jgi:hypothetical protein
MQFNPGLKGSPQLNYADLWGLNNRIFVLDR